MRTNYKPVYFDKISAKIKMAKNYIQNFKIVSENMAHLFLPIFEQVALSYDPSGKHSINIFYLFLGFLF